MKQEKGKILILANNSGGLYNFRFELIEKLLRNGYEVFFTVPEDKEDNEKVELLIKTGAKYIHAPMNRRGMNPMKDLRLIKRYKNIVRETNPDIILTYTIKPNIYGNHVANKFRIPTIMNITGMGSSMSSGRLKPIIRRMYKYGCGKATIVFFQNEGNFNFFINNKLVSKKKAQIIPGSGVNIAKFKPLEKTTKDNKTRFLFIGRLIRDKGISEYIEVAQKLTGIYPTLEFQILGTYEEEYTNLIDNNKNAKIKYLGVSNDVRNEIREVDCIVHPSYHEGMSNALLEAGSMGKPLLASNISGCKEIVEDNINGFLFDPKSKGSLEEAIIKFLNLNTEKRRLLGQASRKRISKKFDRDFVIDRYMVEIKKILGEKISNEPTI